MSFEQVKHILMGLARCSRCRNRRCSWRGRLEVVKVICTWAIMVSHQRALDAVCLADSSPSSAAFGIVAVNFGGGVGCCSSSSKSNRLTSGLGGSALGGAGVGFDVDRLAAAEERLPAPLPPPREEEPPPLAPRRSSHSPASYSSKSSLLRPRESENPPECPPPLPE